MMPESSPSNGNTPSDTLPPQSGLNQYTIIRQLGRGGFGTTYLVQDENLKAYFVLKEYMPRMLCRRDTATMQISALDSREQTHLFEAWRARFCQEARTLARLNHPNIIRVKDAFDELGTSYYVMEYIDGQELHHATENRRDEATLQHLLRRLLEALQYLHSQNILHRDIKPRNILVTQWGEPVLIDFGAVRFLDAEHTQTQIGSPGYTPFEQKGKKSKLGPWSDIYALGATFCRVLTGQCPQDSVDRVVDDEFVPLSARAELKRDYSQTFLRSIDKALEPLYPNRWQSAAEWLAELDPAAQEKKHHALQELAKRGITAIQEKDSSGSTPLHWACGSNDPTTVKLLLEAGADMEAKDNDGESPLHWACRADCPETAIILLEAGADINAKNNDGYTPLHKASFTNKTAITKMLLEAGADIEATDNKGYAPLLSACLFRRTKIIKMLLEAGADIQVKDNWGDSPLHLACYLGSPATAKMLLEAGASIDAKNSIGETPLHKARLTNKTEMTKILLEAGADIHAVDKRGETPLHGSCRRGETGTTKLLLEAGADIHAQNREGKTPVELAQEGGHKAIVALLKTR